MIKYHLAESFLSINGEGRLAGQLALFLRFCGCNLACSFCDTKWANEANCPYDECTVEDILGIAEKAGVRNITITGGEPLMQAGMAELLQALSARKIYNLEIETNGSMPLEPFMNIPRVAFTMDYKLPGSGQEAKMHLPNLAILRREDTLKFVVGSREDMLRAVEICEQYSLYGKTAIYFSPVFGSIAPEAIVDFMKEKQLVDVTLQLQMHKVIWGDKKGV